MPYSRILFLKAERFIEWRILITFGLATVCCVRVHRVHRGSRQFGVFPFFPVGLLALLALVLTLYFNWSLAARHYLVFEEPGGNLVMLCFRIKS